jgi:hypothetical protein
MLHIRVRCLLRGRLAECCTICATSARGNPHRFGLV